MVGLKFKPENQNIINFDFIIIIEILAQAVNISSKFWKSRNNLIYVETVCVLRYSI